MTLHYGFSALPMPQNFTPRFDFSSFSIRSTHLPEFCWDTRLCRAFHSCPLGLLKVLFILWAPLLPFASLARRRQVQLCVHKDTGQDFYQCSFASDLCKRSINIRLVPAEKSGTHDSVEVEGGAERNRLHSNTLFQVQPHAWELWGMSRASSRRFL